MSSVVRRRMVGKEKESRIGEGETKGVGGQEDREKRDKNTRYGLVSCLRKAAENSEERQVKQQKQKTRCKGEEQNLIEEHVSRIYYSHTSTILARRKSHCAAVHCDVAVAVLYPSCLPLVGVLFPRSSSSSRASTQLTGLDHEN
ncbi:uncharacterized protein FOMMEDRAFT_162436 [Fomitiporia mediterranea MF3/22]|uniref:uncharacterized protein n=1 Tax=Fomitiporia mediterranea (strain MF3/22) TaxID=694068 RepID=UPI000440987F|nr:uncharacterized protein FOMMEDRAFT_162436 [Fomitiporia mediterranea MF3/22]EJC98084.1 hypothetical protein FOMMEDRAFT_162436 [Fomitiporia mediterranea MF3/22]